MRILFSAFVLILAATGMAHAMGDKPPTEEQKASIEKMKERDRYLAMPKCTGDVILDMGTVKLKVPRGGQLVFVKDVGQIQGLDTPNDFYSCDQVEIKNVMDYSVPGFSMGVRANHSVKTEFASTHEHFDRHKITLKRTTEKNGVERLEVLSVNSETLKLPPEGSAAEYYILPKKMVQTETGEPILYTCPVIRKVEPGYKGQCTTTYYHSSGLYISYRFHRDEQSANFILKRDKEIRDWISSVIVKSE